VLHTRLGLVLHRGLSFVLHTRLSLVLHRGLSFVLHTRLSLVLHRGLSFVLHTRLGLMLHAGLVLWSAVASHDRPLLILTPASQEERQPRMGVFSSVPVGSAILVNYRLRRPCQES
jgi:hypothetical protein